MSTTATVPVHQWEHRKRSMGDSESGEVGEQLLNPHPIKADDIEEKRIERGAECAHYAGDADAESSSIPPQYIKHDDRLLHNDEMTGPPLDDGREQKVIDRDLPISEGVGGGGVAATFDILDTNLSEVQDDPDAPKHPLPNEATCGGRVVNVQEAIKKHQQEIGPQHQIHRCCESALRPEEIKQHCGASTDRNQAQTAPDNRATKYVAPLATPGRIKVESVTDDESKTFTVCAEVSPLDAAYESISVVVIESTLIVKAYKLHDHASARNIDESKRLAPEEILAGTLRATLDLPKNAAVCDVKGTYQNGIVTITFPLRDKIEDQHQAHQIQLDRLPDIDPMYQKYRTYYK